MKPLRNTAKYQKLADEYARNEMSFFFAEFYGVTQEELVYIARRCDSRIIYDGFPALILIDSHGRVFHVQSMESFQIIKRTKRRYDRRGNRILQAYHDMLYKSKKRLPLYKAKYIYDVLSMINPMSYDINIRRSVLCCYLAAAERLNMELEFKPEEGVMDRLDAWAYYIQLVEKNEYTEEEDYWACGGCTGTLHQRVTPSRINYMKEGQVFVFGSNKKGRHIAGAAKLAMERFGAEWGYGEGLKGKSYALPTMEGLESFQDAIGRFIKFAEEHDELDFYVTAVGCGIAGYTAEQVAFWLMPALHLENVYLPLSFLKELGCDYKEEQILKRWEEEARAKAEKVSDVFALRMVRRFIEERLDGNIENLKSFDIVAAGIDEIFGNPYNVNDNKILQSLLVLAFKDVWPGLNIDAIENGTYQVVRINYPEYLLGSNIGDKYFMLLNDWGGRSGQHEKALKAWYSCNTIGNYIILPGKPSFESVLTGYDVRKYMDNFLILMNEVMSGNKKACWDMCAAISKNKMAMEPYTGDGGFLRFVHNNLLEDYVDEDGKPAHIFSFMWGTKKGATRDEILYAVDINCPLWEKFNAHRSAIIIEKIKKVFE